MNDLFAQNRNPIINFKEPTILNQLKIEGLDHNKTDKNLVVANNASTHRASSYSTMITETREAVDSSEHS